MCSCSAWLDFPLTSGCVTELLGWLGQHCWLAYFGDDGRVFRRYALPLPISISIYSSRPPYRDQLEVLFC